jgi:hypothetical protein
MVPAFRNALLAAPLSALVGLNAARLRGVFFLILAADGRLSAPFAPVAGIGDMLVAALAIPLAAMAAGGAGERPTWLGVWNALGALDLVVAVTLGLLSAPGTPFRVFTGGPGTSAIAELPWIMIPTMLVPPLSPDPPDDRRQAQVAAAHRRRGGDGTVTEYLPRRWPRLDRIAWPVTRFPAHAGDRPSSGYLH